jgi:hypothetical protein
MAIHMACVVNGSSVYVNNKPFCCHFALGSGMFRAVECLLGKSLLIFDGLEHLKIE